MIILGWLGTVGLVAAGVMGYRIGAGGTFGGHLLMALLASLLLLFSHCWIMFYLIGTGKAIKVAVAEHTLDPASVEETKHLKNRSYPSLMLAMGLVMVTFIIGGGVATRVVPAWAHAGLFFVTLVVQVRVLLLEQRVLLDNERLMLRVGTAAADAEDGLGATPEAPLEDPPPEV